MADEVQNSEQLKETVRQLKLENISQELRFFKAFQNLITYWSGPRDERRAAAAAFCWLLVKRSFATATFFGLLTIYLHNKSIQVLEKQNDLIEQSVVVSTRSLEEFQRQNQAILASNELLLQSLQAQLASNEEFKRQNEALIQQNEVLQNQNAFDRRSDNIRTLSDLLADLETDHRRQGIREGEKWEVSPVLALRVAAIYDSFRPYEVSSYEPNVLVSRERGYVIKALADQYSVQLWRLTTSSHAAILPV